MPAYQRTEYVSPLAKADWQIDDARIELAVRDKEIGRLREQVEALTSERDDARYYARNLREENTGLRAQIDSLLYAVRELQDTIRSISRLK